MSNLLKQCFITQAENEIRIINSNERIKERLKDWEAESFTAQGGDSEEEADETAFEDGIAVQEIDLEAIREEVLAKANAEAEQIIASAQEEADRRLQDAENQVQALFEEHKKLGYETGAKEKEEELEHTRIAMVEELNVRQNELTADYEKKLAEMESDVVDAVTAVFNSVFQIQFDDKREILMALVANTLAEETPGKSIRIRVNEKNRAMLEEHLDELQEKVGHGVEIEFIHDTKLSDEQCRIETEYGVFDCGVDTQLSGLLKDIRSLVTRPVYMQDGQETETAAG